MKNLLLALQFLTIIPVKIKRFDEKKIAESMAYFPLVGLFLGLVLVKAGSILIFLRFGELFIDTALVVLLIMLTGGIHLDGLADTCDGLFSGKNKEGMLEIMRDSRIGTMGVLALVSVILSKVALLFSLGASNRGYGLFLICLLSRWAMVFLAFLFPYARIEGKAKSFIQGMKPKIFILATIITIFSAIIIWGKKGVFCFWAAALFAYLFGKFSAKKINGITGDVLGAASELTEVVVLLAACIIGKMIA